MPIFSEDVIPVEITNVTYNEKKLLELLEAKCKKLFSKANDKHDELKSDFNALIEETNTRLLTIGIPSNTLKPHAKTLGVISKESMMSRSMRIILI